MCRRRLWVATDGESGAASSDLIEGALGLSTLDEFTSFGSAFGSSPLVGCIKKAASPLS